jgi:hypothetical protein
MKKDIIYKNVFWKFCIVLIPILFVGCIFGSPAPRYHYYGITSEIIFESDYGNINSKSNITKFINNISNENITQLKYIYPIDYQSEINFSFDNLTYKVNIKIDYQIIIRNSSIYLKSEFVRKKSIDIFENEKNSTKNEKMYTEDRDFLKEKNGKINIMIFSIFTTSIINSKYEEKITPISID